MTDSDRGKTYYQPSGATEGGDHVAHSPNLLNLDGESGTAYLAPAPSSVSFFVPGEPVAKGRPRFVRATGRTYTPAKTIAAERSIQQFAEEAMRGYALFDGPVVLNIECGFPWPKSASKKRRNSPGGSWKETKPDFDNLIKQIADSLNGVVWTDDGKVASVSMSKFYTDKPGTNIIVSSLRSA